MSGTPTAEDLTIGTRLGPVPFDVTPQLVDDYREATSDDSSPRTVSWRGRTVAVAPPMVLALAMNAAARMAPSPPGSIHARQRFRFLAPVPVGARIEVSLEIADVYVKRDRSYVDIAYTFNSAQGLIATGTSSTIWASPHPEADASGG